MIRLLWLLLSHRDRYGVEGVFYLVVRSNRLGEPAASFYFDS